MTMKKRTIMVSASALEEAMHRGLKDPMKMGHVIDEAAEAMPETMTLEEFQEQIMGGRMVYDRPMPTQDEVEAGENASAAS